LILARSGAAIKLETQSLPDGKGEPDFRRHSGRFAEGDCPRLTQSVRTSILEQIGHNEKSIS
jgi:hypothetical protein